MMRRLRILSFLLLACACLVPAASGQTVEIRGEPVTVTGAAQGFPPGMQDKTGTGRIRGRVVSADSGGPLRRAQVRIAGPDIRSRSAMTDGDGRYEFTELPAGRYTVMASKAGYVNLQYGQTRPLEPGKPIDLADGQAMDRADFVMPRGSAIAGRVVDEFGEPVADAIVLAMRQQWVNGRRRLVPSGRNAQTNDLGQYRIYGLSPGDYYVSATVRNAEGMGFEMMLPGAPATRSAAPASGYAPTYFPGTANVADAQKVSLAIGQEAQGTDFALLPTRLARIRGLVIDSEGRPVDGAFVTAVPAQSAESVFMMGGGARTGRDGSFTLQGLAPGDYLLQVRSVTIMTTGADSTFSLSARVGGPEGSEFGSAPVSLSGDDLENVVITTTKGVAASGRVAYDGPPPAGAAPLRLMAIPLEPEGTMFGPGGAAVVGQDGTFQLTGLSGQRQLRVMGLPPGYTVKSVEVNGVDVTDTGIDFKTDAVSGIVITVTSRSTDVSGTAAAANGQPARDFTVVLFAQDRGKWTLPGGRWVSAARPDQDGRFHARGLPPGEYYAVALDYIAEGDWNDPDVLERLAPGAESVTLALGDAKTLSLTLRAAN
jgi:protocatechuate 3,4-dioxygenase beta subunit